MKLYYVASLFFFRTVFGYFVAQSHIRSFSFCLRARHTLSKPLGIILEENVLNEPFGVYVSSVDESGSAAAKGVKKGSGIVTINDEDFRRRTFEDVMETLSSSGDNVEIVFSEPVGEEVSLVVTDKEGNTSTLQVTVGENLRQSLLDSNCAVYRGMEKLTNCGGNGNCKTCAFGVVAGEDNGWGPIPAGMRKRLACQTIVEGGGEIKLG